ncbi:MAG: MFS transporter [bacterium]|nr:MFS transporter [bacterium]
MRDEIRKKLILLAMGVAMFTLGFNTTSVINAIPQITTSFSMPATTVQWVLNIYTIFPAAFILVAGKLGDIFNKKHFFLFGIFLYIVASILIALSTNSIYMIIVRGLQGFSAAFITSASLSILKITFTKKELGFAVGIWISLIGIGNSIGPFGGGFITEYLNWRYIFLVNVIFLALPFLIVCLFFKSKKPDIQHRQYIDYIGFILFSLGMLLFVVGMTETNILGWTNMVVYVLLISGLLLLAVFYFYEKRIPNPLVKFSNFKNRVFLVSLLGLSFATFTAMIFPYFLTLYLQNPLIFAFTPLQAGFVLFVFSVFTFIGAGLSSHISGKTGFKFASCSALLIILIAFIFLGSLGESLTISYLYIIISVAGFGIGIIEPLFNTLGLNIFPEHESGQASGILNTGVYISELFAVISGSIFFFIFGRLSIKSIGKYIPHTSTTHTLYDNILMGENTAIKGLHNYVAGPNYDTVVNLIKKACTLSFTSVMLYTAVLCLILLVLSLRYIPVKED